MTEAYDKAVDFALVKGIDPQEHIDSLLRVPAEPVRLSPEQQACPHDQLEWLGWKGLFRCIGPDGGCGAEMVIPELEEARGLTVAFENK